MFLKSKIVFGELNNIDCQRILQRIKHTFSSEQTENEKNVVLALALHGVFKPTLMGSKNGNFYKPSIVDSQDSFIQLTTHHDFAGAVEEREKIRLSRNITEHPWIVGISTIKEEVTRTSKKKRYNKFIYDIDDVEKIEFFRIIFRNVQYEGENFLKTLDLCFKIYATFKIPYPESKKVWCFLDQAFYGLSNETTSKTIDLLNKLK